MMTDLPLTPRERRRSKMAKAKKMSSQLKSHRRKARAALNPEQRQAQAVRILKTVVSGQFKVKYLDHPDQLEMQIRDALALLEEAEAIS